MSTQVQNRRGTSLEHSTFTGAEGELTYDTNKKTLVAHDGATAGGFPVQHGGTSATANLNDVSDAVNTSGKFAGKQVFNTTSSRPVYATGVNAADTWVHSDGTTAHTPV